jgi:hypothetical protein
MKLDTSKIKLSNKDVSKGLRFPSEVSIDLAYLCGVLAGDGNIHIRKDKYDYAIKCVGNPKDEQEFYNEILVPLFKKVFGLQLKPKFLDKNTTFGITLWSKALVKFLTEIIGLPSSAKHPSLRIPKIFDTKELKLAFIQGVADTDFCFNIRKCGRTSIVGASKTRRFMEEISKEVEELGIRMWKGFDYKIKDDRLKKGFNIINRIEIANKKGILCWLDNIGFRSPKHLEKVRRWKCSSSGRWI